MKFELAQYNLNQAKVLLEKCKAQIEKPELIRISRDGEELVLMIDKKEIARFSEIPTVSQLFLIIALQYANREKALQWFLNVFENLKKFDSIF